MQARAIIALGLFIGAQGIGIQAAAQESRAFPALFGAPSAVAPPGKSGYVALHLVTPRRDRPGLSIGDDPDGDMGFGYTIGNPVDSISLSAHVLITSLTDAFGDSGGLAFDLSRVLVQGESGLVFASLSAGNIAAWGDAKADPENYTATVSYLTDLPAAGGDLPLQFSLSYGTDSTYKRSGRVAGRNLYSLEDGFIAGVGIGLTRNLSASISATATQYNIGIGVTHDALPNWGLSAGFYDVANAVERRQLAVSLSRGF